MIQINNLSKKLKITNLKKTILTHYLFLQNKRQIIWPIKNVSMTAEPGQIIGIIGPNGAGKTTLLRLISGIYKPTNGEIKTTGKVITLIEPENLFRDRLNIKDNIYYFGHLLGLSKKQIKQRFDLIIEFAELGQFTNTKLFKFSKGMLEKLAFSIAMHTDFDILLLDEIFAVGDEHFKKKSINKLLELKKQNKTIVLVSHDILLIKKYCDKIIWLENGTIKKTGGKQIADEYAKTNNN